jgi:hypothetical protein
MNQFNCFLEQIAPGGSAWLGAGQLGMDAEMFHSFASDLLARGHVGFQFGQAKYESMSGQHRIVMLMGTREE